ncbi:hypothetical protein B0T26DRAFT_679596 [Lasiosphaeria miniovina]|uniref:Modin n=1 Tax=Lasiosphaeria miniovina TaxID=1954250 RepID=A0AA40DR81_9PEZI|nr:uncharacterized protein B0T26DRAFT_679596 [Lasiosphaeria miniovina]KAK0710302.1 hypothetical protein B0T26DRAFT_679596 [Lasiosphaeria miniovina]
MNNSTNPNSDGDDGNNGDVLNWVALVVSLVALLGTVAQVLQQYYASAAGYSNCGESVMGEWHKTKHRKFRLYELRFEVQFETPVIFVCPPTNKKGPVLKEPIQYIDGTKESLDRTRALLPQQEHERLSMQDNAVHTADNERATWVLLLSELQSMEKESGDWQAMHYNSAPPRGSRPDLAGFMNHTLAVAVQAKKRSWDNMPQDVKKPYATTAMCHLLEIAAMMGIYWQEFDRSKDRYRGEGNGYMLTGSHVSDLGIMFTFQISGKHKFNENRVIPVDEVKELCCGVVSTLFQEAESKDNRRVFPNEDPKDLSTLQLGSMDEIAETMVLIDCNTNTANYFRSDRDEFKHEHLFPVPFELIGMLGKTLHIRNTAFRMLPNPTPLVWDKNAFNLRRLVKEYRTRVKDSDVIDQTTQIRDLLEQSTNVLNELERDKISKVPGYSMRLLDTLHNAVDRCDVYLKDCQRELVQMVIREHFQEILKMINNPEQEDDEDDDEDERQGGDQQDRTEKSKREKTRHFDELRATSPEERQEKFMEIYFYVVLHQVKNRAVQSFNRRKSTHYAPSTHHRDPSVESTHSTEYLKTSSAPATPSSMTARPVSPQMPPLMLHETSSQSVPLLHIQKPEDNTTPRFLGRMLLTDNLDTLATEIWCTLIFRMLCWLLLHDFHRKDVQLPKSELLGSRLPVYIA